MATILKRTRLKAYFSGKENGPVMIEVNGNPAAGAGTDVAEGSLAIDRSGVSAKLYFKQGNLATDWEEVPFSSGSSVIDSVKSAMAYMVLVQNNDGGWNLADDADTTPIRNKADASSNNQFGQNAQQLIDMYAIERDPNYLQAARLSLEANMAVALTPFVRLQPDVVESLVRLGNSGPMQFSDYLNKGQAALDAEINFYKTIERWHDTHAGTVDANPPVGTGADGHLLDLWTNDNAAVIAKTAAQAAQRFEDRFKASRINNIRMYDLDFRIRTAEILSAAGKTINAEDYINYANALALIARDQVYPPNFRGHFDVGGSPSSVVHVSSVNRQSSENGNTLTGNGVKTLNTLITEWNTANPTEPMVLTAGNGGQVPDNLETVILSGLDYTSGPTDYYPILGYANASLIFKRYEATLGFSTILAEALAILKSFLLTAAKDSTGNLVGLYGVDFPLASETWFSGDLQEQAFTLQALVANEENTLAAALATVVLANQQSTGNYTADIFDIDTIPSFYSEGNANMIKGLIQASQNDII
jgi:hypothetical protein